MEGKALPVLGAVGFLLVLPLIIVLALLLTSLSSVGEAAECAPAQSTGKAFGWPTDQHEVAQGYDDDGPDQHRALDYAVARGSKVMAAEDGQVTSVDGDWIRIRHEQGVETWYRFFESKAVRAGDQVTRGQEIGRSGSGDEDEPGLDGEHLHFELRIQKGEQSGPFEAQDPTEEIGEEASSGSGSCGCDGPLTGTNNLQKAFNYFAANGYTKEQAAGIVGNMIHESSVEPGRLQNTPSGTVTSPGAAVNSSLGWGIVQWTPAGKMIRPSLSATDGDEDKVASLEWQLEFLKGQLEGKPPLPEGNAGTQLKATRTVADAAVAFGRYFERFAGSDDLSNPRYAQRKTAAQQVLDRFGAGAGGGPSGGPSGGQSAGQEGGGCGAGNGDVVKTALQLAWRDRGHGQDKGDAKPEYQAAMPKYNGAVHTYPWSDCGVFVATVMVMSGVDKDYARRGTTIQRSYVKGSPKYETFDNLTSTDQLKPGDIFVNNGHTFIFTGPYTDQNGTKWNAASASLGSAAGGGRVPQAANAYFSDGNGVYTVARIKR